MSAPSATTVAPTASPANPRSRVVLASLIGTTIEFYDFYVYATAAVLVFPHLFFPTGDATTALLSSFAVFGAAMVARPLGAIVFGHLGDKHGRKATLVGALLTMGIATFLIGLLPTYAMVGWLAPLLLVILRIAQGFALGGEWSGAALVATENAPAGKRAWYGTFPQLGAPIGFIIANGLFLVIAALLPSDDPSMPSQAFLDWGWRIPFLFSVVMVIVGLWVRLRLVESTAFSNASKQGKLTRLPLASVFKNHWKHLILGTFFMLATYVLFYLMTTFSLSYGRAPQEAAEGALPGLGLLVQHVRADAHRRCRVLRHLHPAVGPVGRPLGPPQDAHLGHARHHRVRPALGAAARAPDSGASCSGSSWASHSWA